MSLGTSFSNIATFFCILVAHTYFLAKLVSFASEALNASASHCPQGQTVIDFTLGMVNTRPEGGAWVQAFPYAILDDASLLAGTILVKFASFIRFRY